MSATEQRLKLAEQEVKELKERLEAEEREVKEARQLHLRELAVVAHDLLCGYNHTDGCAWGYECDSPTPWQGWTHKRWLDKIEEIVSGRECRGCGVTVDEIRFALKALEAAKKENPKLMVVIDALRRH